MVKFLYVTENVPEGLFELTRTVDSRLPSKKIIVEIRMKALKLFIILSVLVSFANGEDVNIRQTSADKLGADCFFSLKNYSHSQFPLLLVSNHSLSNLSISFEKIMDGSKAHSLTRALQDIQKEYPNAEVVSTFPVRGYEFVLLKPGAGDIGLACDDIVDGNLILKYKENLVFRPNKNLETKNPSVFYFKYLFHDPHGQAELEKRLNRLPSFKQLLSDLNVCVKQKDEECFKKYLFRYPAIGDEKRNKNFHEIMLRGHVLSNPKAHAFYLKTRNPELENDIDLPKGIESMVNKNNSKVWNWLAEALSFRLNGEVYINLVSTNLNESVGQIYVHVKNSPTLLTFRSENGKWFLEDISLTDDVESLKSNAR